MLLALLQRVAETSTEPFFTNDPLGFIKVIGMFALAMSPVYGLVIWWLKRGPEQDMKAHKADVARDLNELGSKVDAMAKEHERDREIVRSIQREMSESHREVLDAIRSSSEAISREVHAVDIRVARMEATADVGRALRECFSDLGDKIAGAMRKTP